MSAVFVPSAVVSHPLPPVYDENSSVLVLGTMPSIASRAANFYYMHTQNRFWKVIAAITGEILRYANNEGQAAVNERRDIVLRHGIALWDVLASCSIRGSSDSSIHDAIPNNIAQIIEGTRIKRVVCTGKTAFRLYCSLCESNTHIKAICLPSTSAANRGRWPLDRLITEYKCAIIQIC